MRRKHVLTWHDETCPGGSSHPPEGCEYFGTIREAAEFFKCAAQRAPHARAGFLDWEDTKRRRMIDPDGTLVKNERD